MNWQEEAVQLSLQGVSWRQIAKELDVPKSTVSDHLRKLQYAPKRAKVLVLDIETAPAVGYYWQRWKTNVGQNQVVREGYILTFAAKWLGDSDVMFAKLPDYELFGSNQESDYELCRNLHALLCEADFVIAHNGRKFDLPTINARMLVNGFTPPTPYKVIDTLDIAKKAFKFPSNSLASLAIYLDCEHQKMDTGGFELWTDVLANDPEAWEKMMTYNIFDVLVLEDVYMKLRPWYNTHPSVAVYQNTDAPRCTCCASHRVTRTDKLIYTSISAFEVWACLDCGKMNRGRANQLDRTGRLLGV